MKKENRSFLLIFTYDHIFKHVQQAHGDTGHKEEFLYIKISEIKKNIKKKMEKRQTQESR